MPASSFHRKHEFLPAGQFTVGTNYWASHAGTHMWRDWQPDVVAKDLARLATLRLRMLRVFPLWPDFQPIHYLRGVYGNPHEILFGEQRLPTNLDGFSDGVAPIMLDRFREFLDLAEQNELTVVVGLITGWMSGRLFVPPALEGRNPITDPLSILWQTRMASRLVREFRNHSAIVAWDLGNECNCMGTSTREQAWVWTAALTGAIRSADPDRVVVSGMHSLTPDPNGVWAIRDQAELTDVLTTHPYPLWTPHCDQDRIDSLRPVLHASAETRLYGDIGRRPAFAEEIGTMGPMISNEATAAAFARASLFSLWAHDCRAALWWCAFDQGHLTYPPYDWLACETELGLLRRDGSPKPAVREIGAMNRDIQELPFDTLPPRIVEAVCLLTPGQDSWGVGQSAFLLAKQAGFDVSFAYTDTALPTSKLYLLPSLKGLMALSRHCIQEIMNRVREGATLYLSLDDAFVADFEQLTGLEIVARRKRREPLCAQFDGVTSNLVWESSPHIQFLIAPTHAEVLGYETNGNPIFTRANYGKGTVYFLGFPLESEMSNLPGVFQEGAPIWQLYRTIAENIESERVLKKSHPLIGITEHPVSDRERIAVLINYDNMNIADEISVATGWVVSQVYRGNPTEGDAVKQKIDLAAMDATIWRLSRNH